MNAAPPAHHVQMVQDHPVQGKGAPLPPPVASRPPPLPGDPPRRLHASFQGGAPGQSSPHLYQGGQTHPPHLPDVPRPPQIHTGGGPRRTVGLRSPQFPKRRCLLGPPTRYSGRGHPSTRGLAEHGLHLVPQHTPPDEVCDDVPLHTESTYYTLNGLDSNQRAHGSCCRTLRLTTLRRHSRDVTGDRPPAGGGHHRGPPAVPGGGAAPRGPRARQCDCLCFYCMHVCAVFVAPINSFATLNRLRLSNLMVGSGSRG